jgi:hypothetical protein
MRVPGRVGLALGEERAGELDREQRDEEQERRHDGRSGG